jgi:hypothetical protein
MIPLNGNLKPMNKNNIAVGLIVLGVTSRLLPHAPNFTAIGATSLFAGLYLSKKHAIAIPIISMLIADLILGFHATMGWVYASYLVIAVLGIYQHATKKVSHLVALPFLSSGLFFVLTNFGVWVTGSMYAHTVAGLIECYTMAIPFLRGTLAGDVMYSVLLIGGYQLITSQIYRRNIRVV